MANDDLKTFVGALGELFQEIDDYARNTDEGPGWSPIVDVNRAPESGLPWLAQFLGVRIDYGSELDARQQIRSHDRWGRGTPLSIMGPASKWVPPGGQLYMSERSPNPWHVTFIFVDVIAELQTYADVWHFYGTYHNVRVRFATYGDLYFGERGDWLKVEQLLRAAKPAGIQFTIIEATNILYFAIPIVYDDYQEVYDAFLTYQLLYDEPFPDISFGVPVYRQLVSIRYYRNIFNQYGSYGLLLDTYELY